MLGKPRILSFFPTCLINSIKHEHSCKILYELTIKNYTVVSDVVVQRETGGTFNTGMHFHFVN